MLSVGSSYSLPVPASLGLLGIDIRFQGLDLLGAGTCTSLQAALTDTCFATIG